LHSKKAGNGLRIEYFPVGVKRNYAGAEYRCGIVGRQTAQQIVSQLDWVFGIMAFALYRDRANIGAGWVGIKWIAKR
jgi:hypothetical protein